MTPPPVESDDDLEIADSGHQASTKRTEAGVEEFVAVVENSGETDEALTVELTLRDEEDVLARHEQCHTVESGTSQRYRYVVPIPSGFDQYVFAIVNRDASDEG